MNLTFTEDCLGNGVQRNESHLKVRRGRSDKSRCSVLLYCSSGDLISIKRWLFTTFKQLYNNSSTKRRGFSIAQKKRSRFVFSHHAALLQPSSRIIIRLPVGCSQADESFSLYLCTTTRKGPQVPKACHVHALLF